MNLKFTDKLRISIYRKQLEENKELSHLNDLTDEELLNLLNSTVLANAVDPNNIRYGLLFNLIFLDNQDKKDRILNQIKRVIALEKNLSKIEKMVIKFGIIHGFQSNNYRKEMFRFIKIPLALKSNNTGRKFISSYKFKEIFYFAYNLIKRGRTNDRPPKF